MVTKAESHQRRMAHREKIESAAMYCHFMVAGGWVTIAAFELVGGELVYGLSLCAPEDQFSRKRGRDAALKRLIAADRGWSLGKFPVAGKTTCVPPVTVAKLREVVVCHLDASVRLSKLVPVWLMDAARERNFCDLVSGPNGAVWNGR